MQHINYHLDLFASAIPFRHMPFRDVEEMLVERGIDVSYETIRRWVVKVGPAIAPNVRSRRVQPSETWHLDEVFVRIGGKRTYLWRAVDDEGEVLEVLAQSRRNKRAALKLMWKLLKKQGYIPDEIVTDKLGSYSAALRELGLAHLHVTGGRLNNRAKVSHQPTRRRKRTNGQEEANALVTSWRSLCGNHTCRRSRRSAHRIAPKTGRMTPKFFPLPSQHVVSPDLVFHGPSALLLVLHKKSLCHGRERLDVFLL